MKFPKYKNISNKLCSSNKGIIHSFSSLFCYCDTNLNFSTSSNKCRVLENREAALRANRIKTNLNRHLPTTKRKKVKVPKKQRKKPSNKNREYIINEYLIVVVVICFAFHSN